MTQARLAQLPATVPDSDQELVQKILAGEKVLYAILMRRYNQRLYRAVRSIVRQDDQAEDIVQHAYVTAYHKLAQYRGDASFGTWLTKIAVNEAFGRIRTSKRRGPHLELVEYGGDASVSDDYTNPERETLRREVAALVQKYTDELPESLRVVFMMRDVEELNTAETAEILGLSQEAVRVRLHRARALMRDQLSSAIEAAPDAFHFAGERCDRIVVGVLDKLGI